MRSIKSPQLTQTLSSRLACVVRQAGRLLLLFAHDRSTWKHLPLPLVVFSLGSWLTWAQAVRSPQMTAKAAPTTAQRATTVTNPGERAFQANCARCHNPPEQLSPRITGTVLRHMRVRALLSPRDERDLLKYLAP